MISQLRQLGSSLALIDNPHPSSLTSFGYHYVLKELLYLNESVRKQQLKRPKTTLCALKRRYSSRTFRYGYLVTT